MAGNGGKGAAHSNLFVGNLTPEATDDRLRSFFANYGVVESCRVVSKDGKTSGFVKMGDVPAAERSIAALNGQNGLIVKFANFDIGGKQKMFGMGYKGSWGKGSYGGKGGWGKGWYWAPPKLQPRDDTADSEKPEGPPSEKLYVKHLPVGITEDDLKATFSKAGEVAEVKVLRIDGSLEWAALVDMSSAEQAAVAREAMDNTFPAITSEPVSAAVQSKSGSPKEDHCYLKGIPTNTTQEKLEALFKKYGEVKWSKVMSGGGSWRVDSTASALVEMGSAEECQKAIAGLNEQVIPFAELGQTIKVRYALKKDTPAEAVATPA